MTRSTPPRLVLLSGILSISTLFMWGCDTGSQVSDTASPESHSSSLTPAAEQPRSPNALPDFELQDLDGQPVRLSDFAGKSVFINFFSTTCPPCMREIPDLIAVHNEYAEDDFVVLGISLDPQGPGVVRKLVQDKQINYPIVMGTRDVVIDYGNIRGIPTSFLTNRRHEQVGKWVGMLTHQQLTQSIEDMLQAEPEIS